MEYVDEKGERQTPVMLHRALFGSLERFIGILIEHYTGKLPAWLSSVQVSVLTISETFNDYAKCLSHVFDASGLRVELDDSKDKVGYKIRQHTLQKVPFMVIVGANEVEAKTVNLRLLNGKKISFDDIESALNYLKEACRPPDMLDEEHAIKSAIQALKTF